jgi:hypothetical protein
MAPKRDWQSLGKKLRRGMPLEDAAIQAGIPIEEAREWAKQEVMQHETDCVTLHRTSLSMLEVGFRKLEQIANDGPRHAAANNADLDAAKELVRASIAIQRLTGAVPKGGPRGKEGPRDLFDATSGEEPTNWGSLMDPNKI